MNDIIEEIHSRFDSAIFDLVKISNEYKNKSESIIIDDIAVKMFGLGFNNPQLTDMVNKSAEKNVYDEKSKIISDDIERYSKIYPFHKFIYYNQVIDICEKYDLFIGKVEDFKGDIPEKNMLEITNFDFSKVKPLIIHNGIYRYIHNTTNGKKSDVGVVYRRKENNFLFICAPRKDFHNVMEIGRELITYKKETFSQYKVRKAVEDPIVLFPVFTKALKNIGFIIVSKWGKEANDINLQTGITN